MMLSRVVWCVDTHTECDPTRLVLGGIPPMPHVDMKEKKRFFAEHYDDIRRFLMHEPRGHKDMFGAIVTESFHEECDFGLLFMDTEGYLDLCGHGAMASVTVMLTMAGLETRDHAGIVNVDTPAGPVVARAAKGDPSSVTIEAVPSFLVESGVRVSTTVGTVPVDVAYGGNFFAFVYAKDLGIEVTQENLPLLVSLALEVKRELNKKKWVHPEHMTASHVELVDVLDEPKLPDADIRCLLVYGDGQVGRDPCATGTCAKIASEVAKGRLKVGECFTMEGLLGTVYQGRAVKECKVGPYGAIVPEISGRTSITGLHQFVLEKEDPLPRGWLLR